MINQIKIEAEIQAMRTGGQMLAQILDYLSKQIQPGITPLDLDAMAAAELKRLGGEPAFLGYQGFPNVLCVSVNDETQHGIPTSRVINDGDVVNLDFGVRYQGLITDSGITVAVGTPSPDAQRLIDFTQRALEAGIDATRAGARVGDISAAVEKVLRQGGLGVVEDLVGHGVGHQLHEDPQVPNYGTAGTGMTLKAGMTIAIEPIATLGGHELTMDSDGWTLRTVDGSLSAQFEHTVLVTDSGAEILTTL